MKKTENVYITHVLFPWETFAAQSEREARERASGGDRWTEDFLREAGKTFCDTRTSRFSRRMNSSTQNL